MHVRAWGDESKPLLVLLHALGCHGGWWAWTAERLAAEYRVLAPDFRGHGDSGPADDYRFDAYAADVEALVGGRPYFLAGHSMGGYVGLCVAARSVAPPLALVVIDMKTGAAPEELAAMAAAAERPARTYGSLEEAVARYRLSPPVHAVPPERLAAVAAECFRPQPDGGWTEKFDRRAMAIEPLDPQGLAARVRCPVRYVRGEHSPVMGRAEARALAGATAPGVELADLVELEGLYHHLPLEAPERLAALLREFCR